MMVSLSGRIHFLSPSDKKRTGAGIRAARAVQDPCKGCELAGLCGDECGMHLHPLDAPTMKFKNLEEFIKWCKSEGWR